MKKQFWQRAGRVSPWVGLLLVTGLLFAGCTTTPNENEQYSPLPPGVGDAGASPTPTNPGPGGFAAIAQTGNRFAIGDLVTVKFSGGINDLTTHEERIKEDGTITLSLIRSVQAAGKTPGELQNDIHDRYVPDYYQRLTVIVTGEQRVYSVGGRVRSPGRQSYIGPTTVTKAIQSAGDFDDYAARRRVVLTRAGGTTFKVDCIKAAKDPSLDLPVYPNDKIDVPMRGLFDFD